MQPIIHRELQVRSRQPRTYWSRFLIAAISTGISVFGLLSAAVIAGPAETGGLLFHVLGWGAFFLCALEGIRVTCDSISQEKREGTLGLLFLTDLRPEEILLGKQWGVSLNSALALLAVVPALAVPILLGGVTGGEFWRLGLALFVTLSFALAVGSLVSVLSESMMTAFLRAVTVMAFFCAALPLADWALAQGSIEVHLASLGPVGMMLGLGDEVHEAHPAIFWGSAGATLFLGCVFSFLACRLLPHFWNRMGDGQASRPQAGVQSMALAQPLALAHDPMGWLATSQSAPLRRLPRAATCIGILAVVAGGLAPINSFSLYALCIVMALTHWALNLWQGLNAVSVGATLRSTGFIELLFITPMTSSEIALGMGRGTARYCASSAARLAAAELIAIVLFSLRWIYQVPTDTGSVVFMAFVAAFVLISLHIDLWAASWMGLFQGLTQRNRATGTLLTVTWVQLFPLAIYGLCFFLGPLFAIIKSIVVMLWARDRLVFELPRLVRAHHIPPPPKKRKVLTALQDSSHLPAVVSRDP